MSSKKQQKLEKVAQALRGCNPLNQAIAADLKSVGLSTSSANIAAVRRILNPR